MNVIVMTPSPARTPDANTTPPARSLTPRRRRRSSCWSCRRRHRHHRSSRRHRPRRSNFRCRRRCHRRHPYHSLQRLRRQPGWEHPRRHRHPQTGSRLGPPPPLPLPASRSGGRTTGPAVSAGSGTATTAGDEHSVRGRGPPWTVSDAPPPPPLPWSVLAVPLSPPPLKPPSPVPKRAGGAAPPWQPTLIWITSPGVTATVAVALPPKPQDEASLGLLHLSRPTRRTWRS